MVGPKETAAERHTVEFYGRDERMLEGVSRLVGASLGAGNAAIVLATAPHREEIRKWLSERGLDLTKACSEGRFVELDAAEMQAKIVPGEEPDWPTFERLVGGAIESAKAAARTEEPVAIFGELVALLWAEGKSDAVLSLERFWNRLAGTHRFSLHCAYPIGAFDAGQHSEEFLGICAEHSVVRAEPNAAAEGENSSTIAYLQQGARSLLAELALRRSEERFRLFVEAVQDYALFLLDAEGRITTWNKGAQRIKGWEAHEILGKHFSCFYPEEDVRAGKPQWELEVAAREGRFEDEGWRVRKDGSRFWANVIITALRDEHGRLYGFGKVTRDFTERRRAQEAQRDAQRRLEESEKSLRELSLHLFRSQEEERRRIGVELHDSLGQNLSFLKMMLDSQLARMNGERCSEAGRALEECAKVAAEAIKEVRTMSYLLYPPMLEEMGLKSAVAWYVDGFAERSGIKTKLHVDRNLGRLSREIETAMFRVLQEALTNVHRHSGSATAEVRLQLHAGNLELEVSDRGKGIPAAQLAKSGRDAHGVGLRGMNERMRQLGGKIELRLTPNGTTVKAIVPVSAGDHSAEGFTEAAVAD